MQGGDGRQRKGREPLPVARQRVARLQSELGRTAQHVRGLGTTASDTAPEVVGADFDAPQTQQHLEREHDRGRSNL